LSRSDITCLANEAEYQGKKNYAVKGTLGSHWWTSTGSDLIGWRGLYYSFRILETMYQPLKINPATPALARRLIHHLDVMLKDAHAMFRLPLKEEGLTAGCNYAAAVFLLEIIGGISTTLYQGPGGSGQQFKTVVKDYYPWDLEGRSDRAQAANDLYKLFRNPFAHQLGIEGKKGGIGKQSFPEHILEKLESLTTAPLNPTLQSNPAEDMLSLSVDSLYWGIRVMILRLTNDAPMMASTEAYLSTIL
jgi:hypothetical protein